MSKRLWVLGLILLGLSDTNVGWAEISRDSEKRLSLEPIVVTATRTPVPLRESLGSVNVIGADEMERRGIRTVSEALRTVPGVDIVQSGGPGATTSVFLRGTNSNHTLVLLDGVPLNSSTTGAFDLSDLTVDNLDRIEVIRGPQSTLYGADALGGVIQIFTRRGEGPLSATASIEGGSFRTFRETVSLAGAIAPIDLALSLSRLDTEGFSRAREGVGNTENDGYANTTWSARAGLPLAMGHRLAWTARYTDSQRDLDACGAVCPVDDLNFIQEGRALTTGLDLAGEVLPGWDQSVRLSLNLDEIQGIDPDSPGNNFRIETRGRWIDWQHNVRVADLAYITLGYEYESQRGIIRDGFDRRLANNGIYLFNQIRWAPLSVNLGVRFDHNNRYGDETTFKTEAAYAFRTGTRIRGAYGTGFHGPTLNDLFFPGFGNPSLRPERSRGVEGGIEQTLPRYSMRLAATYFHNRIDDLIVFVFDPVTFLGMPENVQKARTSGVELEGTWTPDERLGLGLRYTFTEAKNRVTGLKLARRPKHKASLALAVRPTDRSSVDLDLRYVGKRFSDSRNTIPLKDYIVVNLAGTYDITASTTVFARVENLFNRDYEEVAGYGTAGLSAYAGIKVTF